ncbi:tetratricopeptide repeat protein, partial [Vibrio parahaemolyticus]|nr:tetratricopeptide repeat protein [Vibrio parahaemolyticus]
RELAQVVAAQPQNNQARALLGLCLYQLNRLPEAIRELEAVHRAQPDDLGVAYALAHAYLSNDQIAPATELVERVFNRLDSA